MAFRRVVTGFTKDGKSCIKWDSAINPINLRPGFDNIPLWATKKLPAETATDDPNNWELGTSLAGGSVFRFGRYAPGNIARWHSTDSVDYAICISGEMWMEMEDGEVHLLYPAARPGLQRTHRFRHRVVFVEPEKTLQDEGHREKDWANEPRGAECGGAC